MSADGGRRLGAAVVVAGSIALLARPWLVTLTDDPLAVLVGLFVGLGIVGATWPLPPDNPPHSTRPAMAALATVGPGPVATVGTGPVGTGATASAGRGAGLETGGRLPVWLVLGVGVAAFAAGRLLAVGTLPAAPLVCQSLALNSLAAVSEEAFFRRLAYGVAAARGPAVAIGASAVVFAAVHVTVWGWAVLPLDLAAGLVLGWQRWASGGWSVPAATHVAANVLAVI